MACKNRVYAPEHKGAKSKNFEARNPKFETISNDPIKSNSKQACSGFDVLDFPDFSFICVSVCFGFRHSDLCRGGTGTLILLQSFSPTFLR